MLKKKFPFFLFVLLPAFVFASPGKDSLRIRNCTIPLPVWWQEIPASVPDSVTSLELLRNYCEPFKNDSGENKLYIKSLFLGFQKLDLFPAYAADVYYDLGEYDEAINIYKTILPCTPGEQGRSAEWECYCYYKIGKCYEAKKDRDAALEWYRKAIEPRFKNGVSSSIYKEALCAYRCLMNIRCD
jgi:tetratricopeptide (TPR) repeat protein